MNRRSLAQTNNLKQMNGWTNNFVTNLPKFRPHRNDRWCFGSWAARLESRVQKYPEVVDFEVADYLQVCCELDTCGCIRLVRQWCRRWIPGREWYLKCNRFPRKNPLVRRYVRPSLQRPACPPIERTMRVLVSSIEGGCRPKASKRPSAYWGKGRKWMKDKNLIYILTMRVTSLRWKHFEFLKFW